MILWIASILYATYACVQIRLVSNKMEPNWLTSILLVLALAADAFAISHQFYVTGQGFDLGFFSLFHLIAWFLMLVTLALSFRLQIEKLLIPLAVIAAFNAGLAAEYGKQYQAYYALSTGIGLHVVISVLGYSVLTLAVLQALALWQQEAALRNKRLTRITSVLPPLQSLERLLFQLLTIGTLLLTLAIASGLLFMEDIFGQHLTHKVAFTVLAWATFCALLIGHHKYGWRGAQAAKWTLAGFVALMLGFYGTNIVLQLVIGTI